MSKNSYSYYKIWYWNFYYCEPFQIKSSSTFFFVLWSRCIHDRYTCSYLYKSNHPWCDNLYYSTWSLESITLGYLLTVQKLLWSAATVFKFGYEKFPSSLQVLWKPNISRYCPVFCWRENLLTFSLCLCLLNFQWSWPS